MKHVTAFLLRVISAAAWDVWVRGLGHRTDALRAFHALNLAADRCAGVRVDPRAYERWN